MNLTFTQNIDLAIQVLQKVSKGMVESGKKVSKWWKLENMKREFLLQYAQEDEFFVVLNDNIPVATVVLQQNGDAQDWEKIDNGIKKNALYIHWLCVIPEYSGRGVSEKMMEFISEYAKENNLEVLRVDTTASEIKLRKIY